LYYNKESDLRRSGTHYYEIHKKHKGSGPDRVQVFFRYNSQSDTPYAMVFIRILCIYDLAD